MSFFLIRNSRSFGELHKVFTISPIFPDEPVTVPKISHADTTASGQRDKRVWLLMQQEKLSMLLKNSIYGLSENKILLDKKRFYDLNYDNPNRSIHDPSEYMEESKIDAETGMAYGMGYDSIIREIKDKKLSEASQDRLRDLWMNMGFYSIDEVIKAGGVKDIKESGKKIDRKLYTGRHKNAPHPYKYIYNEKNPKSSYIPTKDPEFFSHSTDELNSTDDLNTGLKNARDKYKDKFLKISDDDLNDRHLLKINSDAQQYDNEDENKKLDTDVDFDNVIEGSPLMDRFTLSKLNKNDKSFLRNNIKKAGMEAAKKLKERKRKVFKTYDTRDYLKQKDLEYDVRMKYGTIPSFAELIAEAEDIIQRIPRIKEKHKADEYKRNVHFEPRYLNQSVTTQDYIWSFMPGRDEASFPGFITGKFDFRNEPKHLLRLDEIVNIYNSEGYIPDTSDLTRKVLSVIKQDPNHKHYLENHIRLWYEDIKNVVHSMGLDKDSITAPVVPWEYLKLEKPKTTKVPREKKIEMDEEGYVKSTGKKKRALATAFIRPGTGRITINGLNLIAYCPDLVSRDRIVRPLHVSKLSGCYDIKAEVKGGGYMGQNYALRQAIAKALIRLVPEASPVVCADGLLKVDPRQVERKKTSKHKARKSYTYVKR